MADDFWQDVRHGARLLIRTIGFTTIAVLSIAFGTGADVAMFSGTDAILLRRVCWLPSYRRAGPR